MTNSEVLLQDVILKKQTNFFFSLKDEETGLDNETSAKDRAIQSLAGTPQTLHATQFISSSMSSNKRSICWTLGLLINSMASILCCNLEKHIMR